MAESGAKTVFVDTATRFSRRFEDHVLAGFSGYTAQAVRHEAALPTAQTLIFFHSISIILNKRFTGEREETFVLRAPGIGSVYRTTSPSVKKKQGQKKFLRRHVRARIVFPIGGLLFDTRITKQNVM